jgi:nucleoside-diphosphate-sugar epimerase
MSILVLGGSGFVGRYLIQRLLEKEGDKVISMDVLRPPVDFLESIKSHGSKFEFIPGSVVNFYDITNAIKTFEAKKVVNLAFLLPPASETFLPSSISVNVMGPVNVFEACRLFGVTRVIEISSIAVYGPQGDYGDRYITEDDPIRPTNFYGNCKLLGEKIADRYIDQYGMSILTVRSSTVFGHGRLNAPSAPILTPLVSLPAIGKPVSLNAGRGDKYILIYVEDMAIFLHTLLNAPSPQHRVYNNGGYASTLGELADVVKAFIPGAKIELEPGERPNRLPSKVGSPRAKKEFNFEVRPMKEAVLAQINFARRDAGLKPL